MRLRKLVLWELLFQLRYGILYAALIMTLMWAGVVFFLPTSTMDIALPMIFITDFAASGLLLLSGMVYFEKGQNSLEALAVTPMKTSEYVMAKLLSLSALLAVIAVLLAVAVRLIKGVDLNLFFAFAAAFISCAFFVLLGLILSSFFESFTDLILPIGVLFGFLFSPFLGYVNSASLDFLDYIFWLFPTYSMIQITDAMLGNTEILQIILPVIYLLAWELLLFKLSVRVLDNRIMGKGGGT